MVSGYKKTSCFDEIYPLIEKIINTDAEYLTDINGSSIKQISEFLGISTQITTDISNYEILEKNLNKSDSDINTFYLHEQKLSDTKTI